MVAAVLMALGANFDVHAYRDLGDIAAMRIRGSMAALALDVSFVLERGRHRSPVAVGQHGRESPPELFFDGVEVAVAGGRGFIVAKGMADEAGFAVV